VKLQRTVAVAVALGLAGGVALFLISCSTTPSVAGAPLEIPGAHYVGNMACLVGLTRRFTDRLSAPCATVSPDIRNRTAATWAISPPTESSPPSITVGRERAWRSTPVTTPPKLNWVRSCR